MVDSSDHVTGKTGLSSPDSITLTISKAGGSFAAVGGAISEVSSGWYKVSLTTTDTGTLGDLAFHATATGCDPTDWCDQVTAQILGDTLTANATQINSVSASSVTTINANLGTTQPINFTGTGASALAKSDVVDIAGAAVSASTAQIGVNVVNAGGTAWASGSLTSGVFASGAITATAIAADAIGASELAADAVAEIADAIWDEDATGHQTQGTFGQAIGDPGSDSDTIWALANTNLDATVSSRLATSGYTAPPSAATNAAAVWDLDATGHQTQGTFGQVLGDSGADADSVWSLANTNLDATVSSRLASASYTAPPSAATIADSVWDEDATAHQTQGTFGQAIGDPGADTDTIFGLVNTNLDATVSSRLASASISLSGGAVTVGTNNDKTGYALTAGYDPAKTASQAGDAMTLTVAYDFAKGTTAMTESYAANGVAPTPTEAIYAIHQMLMDFSISGATTTVKKLDSSTTAFAVTLDSATAPTSAHR